MQRIRCAIYTRKSSEDGLEQAFNSLHAQREACAAYVLSQKAEGWVLLSERYDDGGISGGSLDRPALQLLLADIDAGRVDRILVYKIDRLTGSLADFAKIVERLDAAGASFVSVTQSFNTATSMGRLTLNMLLSFAQFERDVTAERIRNKIAASKRKGLWMGGYVPLGYEPDGRTLKVVAAEAETVKQIYELYLAHGSIRAVRDAALGLGLRSKRREGPAGRMQGGTLFDRGHIHHILTNPLYAGRIRHKREIHPGLHPAIIAPEIWEEVQRRLQAEAAKPRKRTGTRPCSVSGLVGKAFDETGDRLTPSHAKTRSGKRLRYYVSHRLVGRSGEAGLCGWRLPAPELEATVLRLIGTHLGGPQMTAILAEHPEVNLVAAARTRLQDLAASDDPAALLALVARIDIAPGRIAVRFDAAALPAALGLPMTLAEDDTRLTATAAFRSRRRGVETNLVLGGETRPVDRVLLANIARANLWFKRLRAGRTPDAIAAEAGTSKRRVQQMIGLAFLAPDIVRAVARGHQPVGLTSDWLKTHELPADWTEQRRLVATL
ncbi:MAG: recombinase family protein [Mangrovicoccus sp.]|nr:recombinase family protein [Mangrovicoccus sp.]